MSRPLIAGYEWRQRVRAVSSPPLFPASAQYAAQLRASLTGPVLATLTTAESTIVRIDDDTVELVVPPAASSSWNTREVVLDLVRTDVAPPRHAGFRLRVRVAQPVTRGLP